MGLPWWSNGWESALQYRWYQFNPRSRKSPYATEHYAPQLLSPCSRAHEPQLLLPRAAATGAQAPQQEKPLQGEVRAPQKGVASAHDWRGPHAATETHHNQNINKKQSNKWLWTNPQKNMLISMKEQKRPI